MSDRFHTKQVIDCGGLKINGTEIITSAGVIKGDIQATAGSIGEAELANLAVTSGKIGADAVITAKIKDGNVTAAKLATGAVETAKIKNGNVTLDKLDAGVAPSHIVKFAGTFTWTEGGASKAVTVDGVLPTDIVMASFLVNPTQAAYIAKVVPTTDTITVTLSAANTSNDAQISYVVYRAAA